MPRSQQVVREWVTANCQSDPMKLDIINPEPRQNLFVLPSIGLSEPPNLPKFLVAAFESAIPMETQTKLWGHWIKMRSNLKMAKHNVHRDKEPQLHLGFWSHYSSRPYVTSETRDQKVGVREEMEGFMVTLKNAVALRVWNLLKRYDPVTLERHIKYVLLFKFIVSCNLQM